MEKKKKIEKKRNKDQMGWDGVRILIQLQIKNNVQMKKYC